MHCKLLHLDDALKRQPKFLEACRQLHAQEIEAQSLAAPVRLWGKQESLDHLNTHLKASLPQQSGTLITFMGSGDFHHVSALLIGMLAQNSNEPLTVIHFDNHPDWVHFSGGAHCGSWVNRALDMTQVEKIITVGVCSRDLVHPRFKRANLQAWRDGKIVLLPWRSPAKAFRGNDIAAMAEEDFLKRLASLIITRNVYVTIDKDVLSHADAITNWDQGEMPMKTLLSALKHVLAHHHAVGIDVTGDYSAPRYAGSGRDVTLKKIESWLDQPHAPASAHADAINQRSNLTLLECLREAA